MGGSDGQRLFGDWNRRLGFRPNLDWFSSDDVYFLWSKPQEKILVAQLSLSHNIYLTVFIPYSVQKHTTFKPLRCPYAYDGSNSRSNR